MRSACGAGGEGGIVSATYIAAGVLRIALELEVALVVPATAVCVKIAVGFAVGVLAGQCGCEGLLGIVARRGALGIIEIDEAVVVVVDSVSAGPDFGSAKELSLRVRGCR